MRTDPHDRKTGRGSTGHGFVADGYLRLIRSAGFQQRKAEIEKSVRAKYSTIWKRAGFWEREKLRSQMERETNEQLKEITPSPYALFSTGVVRWGSLRRRPPSASGWLSHSSLR